MWLTEEWHHWAKRMSNSSHRMLALLFITYFPMPKTVFPSGLTSAAALLKTLLPPGKITGKVKQWLLTGGAVTVDVIVIPLQEPAELPTRGTIKRAESHYSFVLHQLGLNKISGFMKVQWAANRHVKALHDSALEPQNTSHRCDWWGCLNSS